MSKKNRIRLYINTDLCCGGAVMCSEEQAHYLLNVMRLKVDDTVYVFNGRDGEFETLISECSRKQCRLEVGKKFKAFEKCPDIWLMFAPLKKDQTDFTVAKAVELGVAKIIPVITEYTSASKIRRERLQSLIIEAAEQCRRQDMPELSAPVHLKTLLNDWPADRVLFYFDETGKGGNVSGIFSEHKGAAAVLVGPEGGFSEKELEILRNLPYAYGISLGSRILRAETAVIAGLSCWQALCGDWQHPL